MARNKIKSEFVSTMGIGFEIMKRISDAVRAEGGNDDHIRRLLERDSSLPREIAKLLIANGKGSAFKYDKTQDGWELVEDVGLNPAITSAKDLRLVPFLKDGEPYIVGEEVVKRSRGDLRANLGQQHPEWLLENQVDIPEEFRKFVLVFTGTIWRTSVGRRYVPYLCWDGGEWCLGFRWLVDIFDGRCRVVRLGE